MKSLFVLPFLLLGLLLFKGAAILEAVNDNLGGIETVKSWNSDPKTLSQIICEENAQIDASGSNVGLASVVNAARRAYFAGDCGAALAYWERAREIDPQNETAAIMQFLSSGLDESYIPIDSSAEDVSGFLYGLGLQAEQNQKEDLAKYWFASAFELQPSRPVADRLVRFQSSPDEQISIWQKLSAALPEDDPDHWWALGKQAELMQQWVQARDAFQVGADIAPDPYRFLMEQGSLLIKLDRLQEAEQIFKEGLSLRPDHSQPYLQLGNIYRLRDENQTARNWYEQAVSSAPDNFAPNYYLGLTYFLLDNQNLAEQYLSRAIELKPENSLAMYYLALAVYQSGQKAQAQSILEEAVLLDEEQNWNWLVKLGDWRAEANDRTGALEAYFQALRLQPDLPKIANKIQKIENP